MKLILQKFKDSAIAVLPISFIVIILGLTVGDMDATTTIGFSIGTILLIFGMSLFTLGVDNAIMPMGEMISSSVMSKKKLWLVLVVTLAAGLLVTIAEPGLKVFANQFGSIFNPWVLVIAVSIGLGSLFMVAMLKTIFNIPLNRILIGTYSVIFLSALILQLAGKADFLAVAFDSGGSATGSVSVPFIMAFGIGVASIKSDSKSEDSFGILALCAIGPVLATMILGLFYSPEGFSPAASGSEMELGDFLDAVLPTMMDILIPVSMIFAFFLVFQFTIIKTPKRNLLRIMVGLAFTYVGLVMFLIGAEVGFLPVGAMLGNMIGIKSYNLILIPVGVAIGFFIVAAEPAIVVLNQNVEEISGGTIKGKNMKLALMAGVGIAIGVSMLRILFEISIWYTVIPCYIAALCVSFFVPKVFTAVAFDSGGVASGPMTSAFLLPFAMGAAEAVGANIITDAFGIIAMVVVAPPLTIQIMGLITAISAKKRAKRIAQIESDDYEIIELEE